MIAATYVVQAAGYALLVLGVVLAVRIAGRDS